MASLVKTVRPHAFICMGSNLDMLCVDVLVLITRNMSMRDLTSLYVSCKGNNALSDKMDEVIGINLEDTREFYKLIDKMEIESELEYQSDDDYPVCDEEYESDFDLDYDDSYSYDDSYTYE